jgi:uncharacterized protein
LKKAAHNAVQQENFMIDPMAVAFDIDGVVADTISLFVEIIKNDFNIGWLKYEDITSYSFESIEGIDHDVMTAAIEKLLEGNYSGPLVPFEGAPDVLRRLGQHYGPVLFVTARPHPGPIAQWITDAIGLQPESIEIVATGSFEGKIDILLERNISYFIEDRFETCVLLKDAGITPILFKQPWNRQNQLFYEVSNWKELEAIIDY